VIAIIPISFGTLITYEIDDILQKNFDKMRSDNYWGVPKDALYRITWQPFAIGNLERVFFTFMYNIPNAGLATAMIAWIALKLAIGWRKYTNTDAWSRIIAFGAAINSMISMMVALLGGFMFNYLSNLKCFQDIPICCQIALLTTSIFIALIIICHVYHTAKKRDEKLNRNIDIED